MEKVLDLGCGTGDFWHSLRLPVEGRALVGIDIQMDRLRAANLKYAERGWRYLCARGENIPLPDASLNGVFSEVAVPYMHIPRMLAELHRVLVPGGWLRATLHTPGFTWRELRNAFPRRKPTFFRIFVMLNGVVLHLTGNVMSLGNKAESCQTETGMRIALKRAGFDSIRFEHDGLRFFLSARRNDTTQTSAAAPTSTAASVSVN